MDAPFSRALLALALAAGCSASTITPSGQACHQDSDCDAGAYCNLPLADCGDAGVFATADGACHRDCRSGACTCADDSDCPGSRCEQGQCLGVGVECVLLDCSASCPQTSLVEDPCPVCFCPSCNSGDAGAGDAGSPCQPSSQFIDGYCSGNCEVALSCLCADGSTAAAICPDDPGLACEAVCASHGGGCPSGPLGDGGLGCASDAGPAGPVCGDAGVCGADQLCFSVTGCGGPVPEDGGGACHTTDECEAPGACAQSESCDCFRGSGPCDGATVCSIDGGTVSCQFDYP